MNRSSLFEPTTLGRYTLKNRIVLPPLTRQRSGQPGDVPTALMATYYRQRAGAGLLVGVRVLLERKHPLRPNTCESSSHLRNSATTRRS